MSGSALTLPSFYREIGEGLKKTEARLLAIAASENKELEQAAFQLIKSGGKRLRPALLLLAGKCGEYEKNEEQLISAAAAVELIHTASLIHDDIVDETPLRRGEPTLNRSFGTTTAVYCGDLLLAKAISVIAAIANDDVERCVLTTATEMCRGEFLQLRTAKSPDFSGGDYLLRIRRKTANLMATACEIGALIANASPETVAAMTLFGEKLGLAFQITDDILDYIADDAVFGKAVGSDLREGLATMPLICAYETKDDRELIRELFQQSRSSVQAAKELVKLVRRNGGAKKAAAKAAAYIAEANAALDVIENRAIKECFSEIAAAILERQR